MLRLEKINKKIGTFSIANIDFSVSKGDYFVLIGESGAGKSMLLEIITGFLTPDRGRILLNNKNIINIPPQKRNIGIVYQKPTLFPHLTVYENIAYPLKIRNFNKKSIKDKIHKLAQETDISHILNRKIDNLSGGEVQRVTIARTLATHPDILLLDEPLSFLDVQLKKGISSLLRKLNQNGQTIIHVTHDYEEALALANKLAIIENGEIIQSGTLQEIFKTPKSSFVANFIGISNYFKGKIIDSEYNSGIKVFESSGIKFFISSDEEINSSGYVSIPCEAIILSAEKLISSALNNFNGIISDHYQTKSGMEIVIDIGIELTAKISEISFNRLHMGIGKNVWISFKASSVNFIKKQDLKNKLNNSGCL